MDSRRRGSDGLGGPSSTASTASAHPRRSSHDMRDSQASTATNASAASFGSHAPTQSIAFATSDHGVVSVNLTDLSNALGVRRADVVSQRFMFQARSAPSHRIDRSLLGSAFGSGGLFSANPSGALEATTAGGATSTATAGADGGVRAVGVASADSQSSCGNINASSSSAVGHVQVTLTPPLAPRQAAPYQRRHSTLRGTQLDGDAPGVPPLSSSFARGVGGGAVDRSLQPQPQAQPRRRGTPPPGGALALRRALAGDASGAVAAVAGSVPSPLRGAGGLLARNAGPRAVPAAAAAAPLPPPSSLFTASSVDRRRRSGLDSRGGGFVGSDDDGGDGGAISDVEHDDEGTRLLAASRSQHRAAPSPLAVSLPPAVDAPGGEHAAEPGRHSSSSTVASRSTSARTPPPPPLLLRSGSPGDDAEDRSAAGGAAALATDAPSPSRSVHFSENVIESISVARAEDEYMRLLVVYSRPWYAYALLTLFGALLGFSFLSNLYLERGQTALRDRAISVPFMFFLICGTGAAGMLLHLVAVWRPDSEEEHSFFEDGEQRGQLPQLWTLALFFLGGLTTSLVFSYAIGTTVAVIMVIGLVGHLIAESVHGTEDGGDCVTWWDVAGAAVASLGALLTVASGAIEELLDIHNTEGGSVSLLGHDVLVLLGWSLSVLIAGICWTFFTRRLREMSQRVSQQFLLTSSLAVCTVVLGISSYVVDVMLSSDAATSTTTGALMTSNSELSTNVLTKIYFSTKSSIQGNQKRNLSGVLMPCYTYFPDVAFLVGGGVCFLLCWYAYHTVSFYVDHIASAACMTVGATLSNIPLMVLLALHAWPASRPEVWVLLLSLSFAGALTLVGGSGMVVYGGVRYRREVEIRIVVE